MCERERERERESECVCVECACDCVVFVNALPLSLSLSLSLSLQIKYVETSAKHRIHVDKAFHDLVRVIRQVQKPAPVKTRKKKKPCNIL